MLRYIVLFLAVASAAAEKVTFENHKVFRVIPTSDEQLQLLKNLEKSHDGYSFWSEPSKPFHAADLMVSPAHLSEFSELMDTADMPYATYIEDVQQLINQESAQIAEFDALSTKAGEFGWNKYHKLDEIYAWLDSLAGQYPDKIEVINAGRSYEGRVIKGVKLAFGGAESRPGIFIEGGIHAREWISPATVTYLLNAFLTSKDPAVRKLAEAHDWYIFPNFNPDGYVYTHTTNRLWRKTRSQNKGSKCAGADANRNWDFEWMNGGASDYPCDETYAGKSGFSEIETKTMSDYITSIADKLFAYISFHSYSQVLLFPYGHTHEHLDNYDEEASIGLKTVNALSKRYGTRYVSGSIPEVMYIASGSSVDWAKANFKLPITYTFELRDKGQHGFVLPPNQIIPTSEEILDAFVTMFNEAKKYGYPKTQ